MAVPIQITFDAIDTDRLARFWTELLGYQLQPPPEGYDTWEQWLEEREIPREDWDSAAAIVDPDGKGPRIFIQKVSEAKAAKNRMHLDLNVGGGRGTPVEERRARVDEAVARALSLGATELYRKEELGGEWVTLADPEGNEFCMQ